MDVVGSRLRGELHNLLRRNPHTARSALSLAKEWGLDRNISQKVLSALAPEVDAATVLERVPGVESLRRFVKAASKAAGLAGPDPSASAAVDAFETLIHEMGGSQSGLIKRIRGGAAGGSPETNLTAEVEARKRMFHDAADVFGLTVDVLPHIGLIRPVPTDAGRTEGARAYGLLGLKWDQGALPVTSAASAHRGERDAPVAEMRYTSLCDRCVAEHGLLPQFCTEPLPLLTVREGPGQSVVTADPPGDKRAIDLVFGQRWGTDKHPRQYDDAVWSQFVGIKRPTRRLLFDVYMHRSLAMQCVPIVGAYRWCPEVLANPLPSWNERLPGRVSLELLGPGLANAASPAWSRHAEMARFVFAELGWDAEEFVGFRCDVAYPIWNSGVFMSFDFRATGSPGGGGGGGGGVR